MQHRIFLLSLCLAIGGAAFGQRDIGTVDIRADSRTLPVTISSDNADLQRLAEVAFAAHGRYRIARGTDAPAFTFRFTAAGPAQVRLDILATGRPPYQETVSGRTLRNALFRAADVAVERTSGLKGFFAGRLTFIGERSGAREVYDSDFFFGEARQLTNDGKHAVTPRFSPDGSRILFTGYFKTGSPDIHLIDLSSNQLTTLVSFKGTNSGARFSPDGRSIAMVLSGEGNPEIYVGQGSGRVAPRRLTRTQATEASPSWSPDGSQLVFTSDRDGGPQLFTMAASPNAPMQRLPTNISGYCAEPDWNHVRPNLIAFTARVGRGFQIAVYDLSTRQSKWVTNEPMDAVGPVWLNDGRHILFTSRGNNTERIRLVDYETGKTTNLSPQSIGKVAEVDFVRP